MVGMWSTHLVVAMEMKKQVTPNTLVTGELVF